jgi:xylan 1,4-beta-xylosidase
MPKTFVYQNPIYNRTFDALRDAQITVVDGIYYLTGTIPPFWEGPSPGVKLWSSRNLLDWKFEAQLINRDTIPDDAWYKDRFWAPEIHHTGGQFYLTFTAQNEAKKTGWGMGFAVADRITGPYRMVNPDTKVAGFDASLFTDDDGKTYVFHVAKGIRVAEVDLENAALKSERVPCVSMVPGTWEDRVMEGPFCIKRNGIYYLFYSCGARGYEVGYATATKIFGPWTKAPNNPLFGVQNHEACDKMKIPFTGDPNNPLLYAGHNAIFKGPDGRDWTSYLVQEKGKVEQMGIDPIWFENGVIRTNAPPCTRQSVVLPE